MRVTFLILLVLICLSSCKSRKLHTNNTFTKNKIANLSLLAKTRDNERISKIERIDTLLNRLSKSKFTNCHFHLNYLKGHDYSRMHNDIFDELVFWYSESQYYENYIFQKVQRDFKRKYGSDALSWYYCINLLPKRDCYDSDIDHRLDRLPWILRDTSSIEKSYSIVSNIANIIVEPCDRTLNKMQYDYEWRNKMYQGILFQIKAFYKKDEDFDYELHELMLNLKDSLTTRYAYNYVMNNNDLPDGIEDIIYDRFINWGSDTGYDRYLGNRILLSQEEVIALINRAKIMKNNLSCDNCQEFYDWISFE